MVRGLLFVLTALLLASLPGFGQIIFGGPGIGFPGGGYPGRRYPQGGPNGPGQQGNGDTTLVGILRNIGDKTIAIEDDDKNYETITITSSTKYLTTSASKTNIGNFQPGDHISVTATQDNNHNYKAKSVSMVTEGTSDEHSLASLHTNDTNPLPRPDDGSSSSSSSSSSNKPSLRRASSSSSDDDSSPSSSSGKPTLRRASSSSDSSSSSSSSSSGDDDPDRPRLRRASSSSDNSSSSSDSSSSSSSDSSSNSQPRMRRAVSGSDDSGPRAEISPGDSSATAPSRPSSSSSNSSSNSGSYDPDVPRLRRNSQSSSSDSDSTIADARPSLHAEDVNGATRLPPPPQTASPGEIASNNNDAPRLGRMPSTGDDIIDNAREAAFSFSETLPNYVVKQYTTRYQTVPTRAGRTSWQALDVVTADVIEENGSEKYKNILVNGRPPRENVEKTGSWSTGEFSSLQLDVLSPSTRADFRNKRSATIANRNADRFDFSVEQPNSHWHVESEGQSYSPAYTGSIWIDKQTSRVLRIELQAQNMPRSFPLDQVESAVDYDFVPIGEGKYLLPTHSEALSCARAANNCTRNVIEFRNYKKFTADTSITFDNN